MVGLGWIGLGLVRVWVGFGSGWSQVWFGLVRLGLGWLGLGWLGLGWLGLGWLG